MTVSTFTQPTYGSDLGTAYPTNIDGAINVLAQIGQDFAPHQAATANLTVLIDAGKIIKADGTLVEQSQQTITFTAPTANPRISRVVVDMLTGVASAVHGAEAVSPTAPAIPAGSLPCGQVSLVVGQTQITNANITDERTAFASAPPAGFTTGDVKLTLKTVADTGWIMANDGTIGSASSGATTRAHADTEALYTLLWNNISDTYAPVSTGRGASAAADFAANKTIALTKMLGRALGIGGAGAGLTARSLGQTVGAETHVLIQAETPLKNHAHGITDGGHGHRAMGGDAALGLKAWSDPVASSIGAVQDSAGAASYQSGTAGDPSAIEPSGTGISVNAASDATANAHNNMQPTSFLNAMIKL